MTTKFTKQIRKQIVDAYVALHGKFDPAGFLAEVEAKGESHPAWAWFEWDDTTSAHLHRVKQAREFVRELSITYTVVSPDPKYLEGIVVTAPALLSDLETRHQGGGYTPFDPTTGVMELRKQAALSLLAWMKRYEAAVVDSGLDREVLKSMAQVLRGNT